jgi:predicted DCC family thiol-disulfide oxidoreductase YuxK
MKSYFLYDGACGMCHSSVQFFMKFSKSKSFLFSSLDSSFTQDLLLKHSISYDQALESAIYIREGVVHQKSSAVLWALSDCIFPFNLAKVFLILPKGARDFFYGLVAKRRHSISKGLNIKCELPSSLDRSRIINE